MSKNHLYPLGLFKFMIVNFGNHYNTLLNSIFLKQTKKFKDFI